MDTSTRIITLVVKLVKIVASGEIKKNSEGRMNGRREICTLLIVDIFKESKIISLSFLFCNPAQTPSS